MKYHRTKNGQKIKISEMSNEHLLKTIAYFERNQKKGFVQSFGGGEGRNCYYDEDEIIGGRYLYAVGYKYYLIELLKRDLINSKEFSIKLLEQLF
jgi:hypothetical protein